MFTEGYSFPHPVLGLEDDMSGEFKASIRAKRNSDNRTIQFHDITIEITNPFIQSLIERELAGVMVKIYCASTFKTWSKTGFGTSFEIDENDVVNRVEIQMLIVARQNILNYADASFNAEFAGINFSIEKNEIIGVSGKITVPIEKANERVTLGNIFKFFSQEAGEPVRFGYQQDKIHIFYPVTDKGEHPHTKLFNLTPWTACNLFIIPALSGAFDYVNKEGKESAENFEWFQALAQLLPEDEWSEDPYVSAQRVFSAVPPMIQSYLELMVKTAK